MDHFWTQLYEFSIVLAKEAGKIAEDYFRREFSTFEKEDLSPVTIVDRKIELFARKRIKNQYPDHGIIGEEYENSDINADFVWTVDPIDGTKSFVSGTTSFGFLLGLLFQGHPVLGVYYQPILKDLLVGNNDTTWYNGKPIKMKDQSNLKKSTLLATDHIHFDDYYGGEPFNRLIRKVKLYRNWGDCFGYFQLVTGYADIMMDAQVKIWDIVPLVPIINGAGGVITDYYGEDPLHGSGLVAAKPGLHKQVVKMLKSKEKDSVYN